MTVFVGTNVNLSVQKTLGAGKTVTAVTKASPGVVTSAGHGLNDGDIGVFVVTGGMVELDGQICRIDNKTTDTFELEGLDTTDYSTWTAGTFYPITAWSTLSNAQNVSMPNPQPAKADITTLIDKSKKYIFLLPDAPDGQVNTLFDPFLEAVGLIKVATKDNATMGIRITFAGGQVRIFNAYVSGGSGFDMQPNQPATATVAFTPIAEVLDYAS